MEKKPKFDYEFERISKRRHMRMKSSCTGPMAFMCPMCYGITYLEGPYKYDLRPIKLGDRIPKKLYIDIRVTVECTICGFTTEYTEYEAIDPAIVPTISILNFKGWRTKYSCSGHWNKKNQRAYIYFSTFDESLLDEYPLPDGMFKDPDFSNNNEFLMREKLWKRNDMSDRIPTAVLMERLYNWALRLPFKSEWDGTKNGSVVIDRTLLQKVINSFSWPVEQCDQ